MISFTIGIALDGERIDRAVALVVGCTRAEATRLIDDGAVRVDGAVVAARSRRMRVGETLELEPPIETGETTEPVHAEAGVAFRIVYVDESIIVVDKPAGLVVHPGAGNAHGTLVSGLLEQFPDLEGVGDPRRPGIVHRLDKATTGLLVVARTAAAYDALVAQLALREMGREYVALVLGTVESDSGVIDAPIGRSGRHRTRMAVEANGRVARTRYGVERRFATPVPATLVGVRLETGRTHQIRVHFAAIGHPVAGDRTYRAAPVVPGLERPFLHARRLELVHPATGAPLSFASAMPADLLAVLDGLRT